jgi:hypothetical protein
LSRYFPVQNQGDEHFGPLEESQKRAIRAQSLALFRFRRWFNPEQLQRVTSLPYHSGDRRTHKKKGMLNVQGIFQQQIAICSFPKIS